MHVVDCGKEKSCSDFPQLKPKPVLFRIKVGAIGHTAISLKKKKYHDMLEFHYSSREVWH